MYITSIYPAKGRPGSRTTKLDSKKKSVWYSPHWRLWASPPDQCAIGPCRSWTLGQHARVRVDSDRKPLGRPALVALGDFLKIGHFTLFSQFLHIRGEIFRMFFIRLRLTVTPMNHENFHGNRSAHFWEIRKTDTQTDAATLYV